MAILRRRDRCISMRAMSSSTERTGAGDMTTDPLSTVFEEAVRRVFSSYTVVMTRPEAATPGGPHTLQRIQLVTTHRTPLLLGWASATQHRAQLNTLGHTLALGKLRLGHELAMRRHEYARFLESATQILEHEGMTVSIVALAKEGAASSLRARGSRHRSTTLPVDIIDAVTALRRVASRMAAGLGHVPSVPPRSSG
jgi:hypothetical protein